MASLRCPADKQAKAGGGSDSLISSAPGLVILAENLSERGSTTGQSSRPGRVNQIAAIIVSMKWYDNYFNREPLAKFIERGEF